MAQNISNTSYGLVFGLNTFLALAFQTALTLAVADSSLGLALEPRAQFAAYGAFWLAVGALFLAIFCTGVFRGGDGWRGYAERLRKEGLVLGAAGAETVDSRDTERREVPLGSTENM